MRGSTTGELSPDGYVNQSHPTAKPGSSHIVIMQDIPRRKTFFDYFLAKFPVSCSIACTKGRRDRAKPAGKDYTMLATLFVAPYALTFIVGAIAAW